MKRKTVKRFKEVKTSRVKTARSKTTAKSARRAPARRSASQPARAQKTQKKNQGFQLTSIVTSLTVNDLPASMTWYCDILGFAVTQRWEHEGQLVGAELTAGSAKLYLGRDDWKKGRDRIKGQGIRIYWYTDQNIDQIADGIKARGGTLESEPKDEWGTRWFNLEDPTGYLVTISSNK